MKKLILLISLLIVSCCDNNHTLTKIPLDTTGHCKYYVIVDEKGWIKARICECEPGYYGTITK